MRIYVVTRHPKSDESLCVFFCVHRRIAFSTIFASSRSRHTFSSSFVFFFSFFFDKNGNNFSILTGTRMNDFSELAGGFVRLRSAGP